MQADEFYDQICVLIHDGKPDDATDFLLMEAESRASDEDGRLNSDRLAKCAKNMVVGTIQQELADYLKKTGVLQKKRNEVESQWIIFSDANQGIIDYFDSFRSICLFEKSFRPSIYPRRKLFGEMVGVRWESPSHLPAPSEWKTYLEEIKFELKATQLWVPAPIDGLLKYFGVAGTNIIFRKPWMKNGVEISEVPMIAVKEGHYHHFVRALRLRDKANKHLAQLGSSYKKITTLLTKIHEHEIAIEELENRVLEFRDEVITAYATTT